MPSRKPAAAVGMLDITGTLAGVIPMALIGPILVAPDCPIIGQIAALRLIY
jgi:hypothetical protein